MSTRQSGKKERDMLARYLKLLPQHFCHKVVIAMDSSSLRHFEKAEHSLLYARVRPQPPDSVMETILKFRGQGQEVELGADLGCGSGQFTSLLAPHCKRLVASDVSQAMLQQVLYSAGTVYSTPVASDVSLASGHAPAGTLQYR